MNDFAARFDTPAQQVGAAGVAAGAPAPAQLGRVHAGREVVAGVVEGGADAALAHLLVVVGAGGVAVDVGKGVGRLHVPELELAGAQGRGQQLDLQAGVEVVLQIEAALVGVVLHPLVAVVVDVDPRKLVDGRRERHLPAHRHEAVVVVGHHAQDAQAGFLQVAALLAQPDIHVGLPVVEGGVVVALVLLEGVEHVLGVFVAHAGQVAHPLVGGAGLHVGRAAHEAGRGRGRKFAGLLVLNIEHRGELVAVLGLPAAGAEIDPLHQLGVHEAQALLLGLSDQEGPVHLDAVHVEQVFLVVAAAHAVGAAQLVVADHARQGLDDGAKVAEGRGNDLGRVGVELDEADLLAGVGIGGAAPHPHAGQGLGIGQQAQLQGLGGGQAQYQPQGPVAEAAGHQRHGRAGGQRRQHPQLKATVEGRSSPARPAFQAHHHQLQGRALGITHGAGEHLPGGKLPGGSRGRGWRGGRGLGLLSQRRPGQRQAERHE